MVSGDPCKRARRPSQRGCDSQVGKGGCRPRYGGDYRPVIFAPGRLWKEEPELKVNSGYTAISRAAWAASRKQKVQRTANGAQVVGCLP